MDDNRKLQKLEMKIQSDCKVSANDLIDCAEILKSMISPSDNGRIVYLSSLNELWSMLFEKTLQLYESISIETDICLSNELVAILSNICDKCQIEMIPVSHEERELIDASLDTLELILEETNGNHIKTCKQLLLKNTELMVKNYGSSKVIPYNVVFMLANIYEMLNIQIGTLYK